MFGRPRSLFWSLTASILAVLILTAALQLVFALLVLEPIARARQGSRAEELIDAASPELVSILEREDFGAIPRLLVRYQRFAEGMLIAFEPPGRPLILPAPPGRPGRGPGRFRREGRPPIEDLPVIARQDVEAGGEIAGQLVVLRARPGPAFSEWIPLRQMFLLPGALVAAALGGMWIFRRLQRRFQVLEAHARAVGHGNLDVRIADPGDDELGRLGEQLNAMTASLAAARERVETMESERKRMLADITHELATPLTSVQGYAETLLDDVVALEAEDRERYLRDILHASERMRILTDDLLDLARLEGGAAELQPEPIDLVALVRNTVDRQRERFAAAGLVLGFSASSETVVVRADGLRLEQIVDNLLSNALRHVPRGGQVEVAVNRDGAEGVVVVSDDGPGFTEESLPHVFDRFYRAEASRTTPGSGLGLAIVREIAARHGGSVEAASRAEGGASLTVRLPLHD
jgi:signal transduction histidine kinase